MAYGGRSYLLKNGSASLEAVFDAAEEVKIDNLFLEVGNRRFPSPDFKPVVVKGSHRQSYLFDLNRILDILPEDKLKEVAFIAAAHSAEYRSPLFDISSLIT